MQQIGGRMVLEVLDSNLAVCCDFCGNEIKITRSRCQNNKHYFCNQKCFQQFKRKNLVKLTCPICETIFYRKKSQVDKLKDISHATCSKECCYELRKTLYLGENNHQYGLTGSKNSSWKSDERCAHNDKRYKLVRVENHPFRDKSNFVPEHRLVAEQYLLNDTNSIEIDGKRYLKPECIVHHIDFNKTNNKASNLFVFDNESIHVLFHNLYKSGRVSDLENFFEYYQNTYINKLYNYQWLYRAYIEFDLSINQISHWFNIPYVSVKTEVYKRGLDQIKTSNEAKESFKKFVIQELSNVNFNKQCLGSSGK